MALVLVFTLVSGQMFEISGVKEKRGKEHAKSAIAGLVSAEDKIESSNILSMTPLQMDFGPVALYTLKKTSVVVKNSAEHPVDLLGADSEDAQFKVLNFQNKSLLPGTQTILQVLFVPEKLGTQSTYLILKTDYGDLFYKTAGTGTKNPYEVQPIEVESVLGSQEPSQLELHNPFDTEIQVDQVFSSDPSVFIEMTHVVEETAWKILPQETKSIVNVNFRYDKEGTYYSKLHVKLSGNHLIIPIKVTLLRPGLQLTPDFVYFGILSQPNLPYKVPLYARNTAKDPIKIKNIVLPKSLDYLEIYSNTSVVVPSAQQTQIGSLVFYPIEEGDFQGTLKVQTNDTDINLEYRAVVYFDLIEYNHNDTVFKCGVNQEKEVNIINRFSSDIWLESSESDNEGIAVDSFPTWMKPGEKVPIKLKVLTWKKGVSHVKLFTSLGPLPLKISVEDTNFSIFKIEEDSETFSKTLDFGPLELRKTRTQKFAILNRGNSPLVLKSVNFPHNTYAHFHSVKAKSPKTPLLEIQPNEKTYFDISVIPTEASKSLNLKINFADEVYNIPITYEVVKGSVFAYSVEFPRAFSGVTHENPLVIFNNYTSDLNIQKVTTDHNYMTVELYHQTIPKGKKVVAGAVKVHVNLHNIPEYHQDFSKGLSYGEIRMWNEKKREWSEGELGGTVRIFTDISGEIDVGVKVHLKKPLLSLSKLNWGNPETNSKVERTVKIENPTEHPLQVQLFLDVSNQIETLKKECVYGTNYLDHEEFENMSPGKERQCGVFSQEEIKEFISKRPLPHIPIPLHEASFLEKLKNSWNFQTKNFFMKPKTLGPECGCNEEIAFYLDKNEFVIPGMSSGEVGPIYFLPTQQTFYNATLVLRNNLTYIETIPLRVQAYSPKLSFVRLRSYTSKGSSLQLKETSSKREISQLSVKISLDELHRSIHQIIYSNPHPVIIRGFELENHGVTPVSIKKLLLNGFACNYAGVSIPECTTPISVSPGKTQEILVYYYPNFVTTMEQLDLWIVTEHNIFSMPLEVRMPKEVSSYSGISANILGMSKTAKSSVCSIAVVIFLYMIFSVYKHSKVKRILVTSITLLNHPFKVRKRSAYSPPIIQAKKPVSVVKPPQPSPPPPAPEPELQVPETSKPKKIRVKKTMDNTLIQKVDQLAQSKVPKVPEVSSHVIATNKLLLQKKKKTLKTEEPTANTQESYVTSEDEQDFLLDDYKQKNELFSRWSFGHYESID